MKLLFSCFMVPVYIAAGAAGLCGLFIYLDSTGLRPAVTHSFLCNMYFGLLHLSMAVSLTLAIFVNFVVMLFAVGINRVLEKLHLLGPLIRLTGLIIAAVAVQMVIAGLRECGLFA